MPTLLDRLMPWRGVRSLIKGQVELADHQAEQLIRQAEQLIKQAEQLSRQAEQLDAIIRVMQGQDEKLARMEALIRPTEVRDFSPEQLTKLNPRFSRNILPNDNVAVQKQLMATWRSSPKFIDHQDLRTSGFRVFSQNDEDGVLLRIFSHIGETNRYVVEIGSNCSGSDLGIPENLSTNLICNHGWHGAIFELDPLECARTRHFFARDYSTKHFHVSLNGQDGYFSPVIVEGAVSPENINQTLSAAHAEPEPDLLIIDIDGGDYAVVQKMTVVRPRVMVVEFEKRFRDRHSVVQFDSNQFSKRWAQSGAASLPAWEALFASMGYTMCAIGNCGFNAFFVRSDLAGGKFKPLTSSLAFDEHPILSKVSEEFWLSPDETWHRV
jgi:hypothetical protein